MEFFETIAKRRSVREYTDEQITERQLDMILKAGCAAPVGMGDYYSMHITVIQDKDLINTVNSTIQENAHFHCNPLYDAPTLIIISSEQQPLPEIDMANASCIMENMLLAAADQGLGSCFIWASAITVETIPNMCERIGIPDGFKPVAGLVVGYPAEPVKPKNLELTISVNKV